MVGSLPWRIYKTIISHSDILFEDIRWFQRTTNDAEEVLDLKRVEVAGRIKPS
jgi:hypothetical protein